MVGRQFGADGERRVVGDAEFDDLRLGLDFGLAESATLRLRNILRLRRAGRSEEHTSELQSLMRISYAVFCLKKNKKKSSKNTLVSLLSTATCNEHKKNW